MKKRSKLSYLLIITYIMFFLGGVVAPSSVSATSETTNSETASSEATTSDSGLQYGGFSYEAILPENQINSEVTYFDLRMTPSQQQTVQIEMRNTANTPRNMLVSINGAKTSGTGVIEYARPELPNDASLKFDFADLVTAPESIEVPANGSVMLDINIQMPETTYDGIIVGGIELKFDSTEEEPVAGAIKNEYAYVIGMRLSETDTVVTPDLTLNSVGAGQSNARNAVLISLSNTQAVFLENLTMDVQITSSNSDEVLYDTKVSNMRMAPNTLMEFPVSMNGEAMEPGEYRAIIVATAGDLSWNWEEIFTITDAEADEFNSADVSLSTEAGINWLLVLLIAGGLIVVGLAIFAAIHLIRKNKQNGSSADKGNSTKNKKKARK